MIGAGAKVLANIEVGANARIAAGSIVLRSVPAKATVAGVPAKIVRTSNDTVADETLEQILIGAYDYSI
jgi:serine O-acetyltransferase